MLGHIIQLWDHLNYADGAYGQLIQLQSQFSAHSFQGLS